MVELVEFQGPRLEYVEQYVTTTTRDVGTDEGEGSSGGPTIASRSAAEEYVVGWGNLCVLGCRPRSSGRRGCSGAAKRQQYAVEIARIRVRCLDRFVTFSNLGVIWIIACRYEDERQATAYFTAVGIAGKRLVPKKVVAHKNRYLN
jgi:hypothetical protein